MPVSATAWPGFRPNARSLSMSSLIAEGMSPSTGMSASASCSLSTKAVVLRTGKGARVFPLLRSSGPPHQEPAQNLWNRCPLAPTRKMSRRFAAQEVAEGALVRFPLPPRFSGPPQLEPFHQWWCKLPSQPRENTSRRLGAQDTADGDFTKLPPPRFSKSVAGPQFEPSHHL